MQPSYTCFDGVRRIAQGSLPDVAVQLQRALRQGAAGPLLLFDDASGRTVDIDTRGSASELRARVADAAQGDGTRTPSARLRSPPVERDDAAVPSASEPRGRGRPRLGVVAREVTLLPRHWDWLAAQPGGASVVLRKLVEQARRQGTDDTRQRHERAYHFMSALAGDLPGYEEAIRALFANDEAGFANRIGAWPSDVRLHAMWLAFGGPMQPGAPDRDARLPGVADKDGP